MAKRFTDTEIWDKEWFMALPPKYKCLTRLIFDKCDLAGVWSPNWLLASNYIGEKVTVNDLQHIPGQFEVLPDGKIFAVSFITFQYGELSENCKPHQKVIATLKKHNLLDRVSKGYIYPIQRDKDKDKDKEKEKEKDKRRVLADKSKEEITQLIFANEIWLGDLAMTHRGKDLKQAWEECYMHWSLQDHPPNTINEWQTKLNSWLSNKKPVAQKPNQYQQRKFVA